MGGEVVRVGDPTRIVLRNDFEKIEKFLPENLLEGYFDNLPEDNILVDMVRNVKSLKDHISKLEHPVKQLAEKYNFLHRKTCRMIFNKAKIVVSTVNSSMSSEADNYNNFRPNNKQNDFGSDATNFEDWNFDTVIIEEAGQCLEISAFQAMMAASKNHGNLLFIGDHKQLPPTVFSSEKYSSSILDKVITYFGEENHKMLDTQYRMNAKILEWSNENFYNGKLKSGGMCRFSR